MVVLEITWLTDSRPPEIHEDREREYPGIDTASSKIALPERNVYTPAGYFALPEHCWLEGYYHPMQAEFQDFFDRNGNSDEARTIVERERHKVDIYLKYHNYYSHNVSIAKKVGMPPA